MLYKTEKKAGKPTFFFNFIAMKTNSFRVFFSRENIAASSAIHCVLFWGVISLNIINSGELTNSM
jgi:hypothetical protein